ncbi:hypothetical protein REPUB_Repub05bG0061500 [Reevesia pubescens]
MWFASKQSRKHEEDYLILMMIMGPLGHMDWKRRFLWASVSALDFDDTLLFDYKKGGFYGIGGLNFIDFVDRVLMRTSKSSIHKIRLHCSMRHRFHLDSWIDNALKRKVQELDLSIDKSDEENADFWSICLDYKIVVDVPKLEDLKYKDYVASGNSFKNLHSLVRSKINVVLRRRRNQIYLDLEKMHDLTRGSLINLCGHAQMLAAQLKTVRIWGFNGQENAVKFMTYLQENGNVSTEFGP